MSVFPRDLSQLCPRLLAQPVLPVPVQTVRLQHVEIPITVGMGQGRGIGVALVTHLGPGRRWQRVALPLPRVRVIVRTTTVRARPAGLAAHHLLPVLSAIVRHLAAITFQPCKGVDIGAAKG